MGRGTIWSPYLVTLRQSALYTMCRHKHYYVILTVLISASGSLVARCLAHGFMSLVRSQPWPTLFNPNPLVTADRIGVSVLDLCQHISVR